MSRPKSLDRVLVPNLKAIYTATYGVRLQRTGAEIQVCVVELTAGSLYHPLSANCRNVQTPSSLQRQRTRSVRLRAADSPSSYSYFAQIQGCDAILARMQEMLLGFQADLGGISDEIKHLQVYNSSACGGSSSKCCPDLSLWIRSPTHWKAQRARPKLVSRIRRKLSTVAKDDLRKQPTRVVRTNWIR